ncbi:ribosome small subunit-dependent GTPase A [Rugosibacter aromaticivorans]|uniref:ribosome small subunit-dependent GTPase A n=1 Tax=Rugosibacter aromaticivorans TaxID=1565605 RepID=UPI000AE9D5D7|nr:ribosome small subunit-dependent GTPase A [Rugosibacter aromaticivorans]
MLSFTLSERGTIIAAFGRHYEIEFADGRVAQGFPKGKKSPYAVGDVVELTQDGQITSHLPRKNLLYRSDAYRQKLIAANATQLLLVVATEPSFSDLLLSRALLAAEHEGLRPLIVLNKCDLTAALPAAHDLLAPFVALGYPLLTLSAAQDATPLLPWLAGEVSVLVGQSGMGKSTLTNALVPHAAAAIREISTALDSGKHTTTYARLYHLPNGGQLIDCPGVQVFGLAQLSPQEIESGFVEFRPLMGTCRFRDCKHSAEPGCAVKAALASGAIHPRRLAHYHQIMSETSRR